VQACRKGVDVLESRRLEVSAMPAGPSAPDSGAEDWRAWTRFFDAGRETAARLRAMGEHAQAEELESDLAAIGRQSQYSELARHVGTGEPRPR
jgi:hypothetical protein